MASAFEKVRDQAMQEAGTGSGDQSHVLRHLVARQRKALSLFRESREVSAKEIAALFSYLPRTATGLCGRWVAEGFLVVSNSSRKAPRYKLAACYEELFARNIAPRKSV